jgi:transposase-like protein
MAANQIQPKEQEKQTDNKNLAKCRWCKSEHLAKKGFRQTQKRGKIQRYVCRNCGKAFTVDEGFYRMRNSEKVITMSVDMYLGNMSSRKMRNQLQRHMDTKISHISILDWVRRYVLRVHRFVDNLNPSQLGKGYYADGTMIERGGQKDVFWACVDWQTRMIVGTHYSLREGQKEAREFLKKSVKKGLPNYIQTDSAMFYPRAFAKTFYSRKKKGLKVEHREQNTRKTGKFNVRIETVFSKIKDRVNDMRGLKALWSAPILLAGIVLQHNFIEEHTTTRQIPCTLAGLDLQTGQNRWLGLIRLASVC